MAYFNLSIFDRQHHPACAPVASFQEDFHLVTRGERPIPQIPFLQFLPRPLIAQPAEQLLFLPIPSIAHLQLLAKLLVPKPAPDLRLPLQLLLEPALYLRLPLPLLLFAPSGNLLRLVKDRIAFSFRARNPSAIRERRRALG
jgi:hypothetical protein